jgi:hypothetical protein
LVKKDRANTLISPQRIQAIWTHWLEQIRVFWNTGNVGLQATRVRVITFDLWQTIDYNHNYNTMLMKQVLSLFRNRIANNYAFSRRARNSQIILHTPQQI